MTLETEIKKLLDEDKTIVEKIKEMQKEADTLSVRRIEIAGALKTLDQIRNTLIAEQKIEQQDNPNEGDAIDEAYNKTE